MTSFAGWLKVTIDNKPWWAIIVAAALGAEYHAGELSQTLGIHNLPQIDLWA